METATKYTRVTKWASVGVLAVALFAGGLATGHTTGTTAAREEFCNLQFVPGTNIPVPVSAATVNHDLVPPPYVVADAACTDDQITAWNEAMAERPSGSKACRLGPFGGWNLVQGVGCAVPGETDTP